MEIEVLPPRTFASGKRVGRPPSAQNESTKLTTREKIAFNRRASLLAGRILTAQSIAALGAYHVIELTRDKTNPTHILSRNIVRDIKRQEKLLETPDTFEYGRDFIIVEGTPADFRAGDAILNRAWGKPKEIVEIAGDVNFSLRALHLHTTSPAQPTPKSQLENIATSDELPLPTTVMD